MRRTCGSLLGPYKKSSHRKPKGMVLASGNWCCLISPACSLPEVWKLVTSQPASLSMHSKIGTLQLQSSLPRKLRRTRPLGEPGRAHQSPPFMARSSSREVRIRVPFSVVYLSRGTLPPKKGKRAQLENLDGNPCGDQLIS